MIDILLATYNGEKYLSELIESILAQSNNDWRLVIHDDGSSDNTLSLLKAYQEKNPDKIQLIDDGIVCGGAKENFSHLMSHASAPYIMFCDQDDVWLKDKVQLTLNRMLELESAHPAKPILVHTDLAVVDNTLNRISDSMFRMQRLLVQYDNCMPCALAANVVTGCTMMINRQALIDSLPIPNSALMHDWWVSIMVLKAKGVVSTLPQATILYRQHASNELGAKEISASHYLAMFLAPVKLLRSIRAVAAQVLAAGFPRRYVMVTLLVKFYLVLRKSVSS